VLRRHETDEIRERLFPKDGIHRRPVVDDAPALEELDVIDRAALAGRVALERIEEVLLVPAKVFDPTLLHQRDELRRDRTFARPQSTRRLAEKTRVLLDRQRELRRGILRPAKALREFAPRQAAIGKRGIVD